jgi:hypothetical protein
MRRAAVAGLAIMLVAGCSSSSPPLLATSPTHPQSGSVYRGPLSSPAERALECRHRPFAHGSQDYLDGLAEVADNYQSAARDFLDGDDQLSATVPSNGYRIERRGGPRVLFSWDVDGRTKVAIIARDGMTDYLHRRGWGVESWAECDPAEFPASTTDALGIGVWQNRAGQRVPVAEVRSSPGQHVCDFAGTGFLEVGTRTYVQDPHGTMRDYLRTPYAGSATLPADAQDSGWHRDGRELWLAGDRAAAYLVSTESPSDVQRWPATKPGFGCG